MRAFRRAVLAALAATAAVGLAGCGTSQRDQVKAKVAQFVKATAKGDYKTLCTEVLAPSLLQHFTAYGLQCEHGLAMGFGNLHDPQLAIGGISIHGDHASVTVLTTAQGQDGSLTALELTDTSIGWRISGLGTPQVPTKPAAK